MVHNRIAVWRAEQSVSRRQLADAAEVHVQTIGFIERGDHSPSLEIAMRIAERLGAPVESVFSLRPFPSLATELGQTTAIKSDRKTAKGGRK